MQRAETDFKDIGSALRTYKLNAGNYPTNSQGLQALVSAPEKSSRWVQIMDKVPVDPWGSAYGYKVPGIKKPTEFELTSAGPDQKPGTEDDLSSQDK
jgi:general secretion pathway protein G